MPKTQIFSHQLDALTDKTDCCNPALKVTLAGAQPPIIDIEYICDADTNTWQKITHVTPVNADGTVGTTAEMIVDTGIACDEPKPDYEPISVCRNNTIHLVTFVYQEDGTQTETSAIDTGVACNESRDVDVLVNCDGTTKTVTVGGVNATQVVFDQDQVLKVQIDKSCDTPDLVKVVTKNIDCSGSTADVDTTKTVEAVIDQVVDVKQCNKVESISEKEVCVGTSTYNMKTTVDSEGTETIAFFDGENPVTAPTTYTIGACVADIDPVENYVGDVCYEIDNAGTITSGQAYTIKNADSSLSYFDKDTNVIVDTTLASTSIVSCIEETVKQDVQVLADCAGTTQTESVDQIVSIAGNSNVLNVRIVEDCVPNFDTEVIRVCSSVDGRGLIQKITKNEETRAETIGLFEIDATTAVADGSTAVECVTAGSDYETTEICRYDEVNDVFYKLVKFVNSSDVTDTFDVWLDVDGNTVAPVAGTVSCESTCEVDMAYERCFNTGAGVVTLSGYFVKEADYTETYKTARVLSSTDAAFDSGDDVISETWLIPVNEVACQVQETTVVVSADGVDIPNNTAAFSIPVGSVKSFTVVKEGGDDVIITTPSGTVTMHRAGSRTFGTSTTNGVIDTTGFSIQTGGNSNADIIWEL